jgi:nucleoid-associated protein YgaU
MGKSRYSSNGTVGDMLATRPLAPVVADGLDQTDLLSGIKFTNYTVQRGDRLDVLAARFLNDDTYGWVIALVNGISYMLGLTPGQVLRIPNDVRDVLDRVLP